MAEAEIYDMVDQFGGFAEPRNKAFLLLVDVYIGMADFFQARATIEAIETNVEDQKIKDEAKAKLEIISLKEAEAAEKLKQPEVIEEINIEESSPVIENKEGGNNE
jgi:hypothetical protein